VVSETQATSVAARTDRGIALRNAYAASAGLLSSNRSGATSWTVATVGVAIRRGSTPSGPHSTSG
jgi:hypothetical protein